MKLCGKRLLKGGIPELGSRCRWNLVNKTADLLFAHSRHCSMAHPRFFPDTITSSPAAHQYGAARIFLQPAVNAKFREPGNSSPSLAVTEIEAQTVRWIAEFIGYPTDCGGLLVSGGNMANFVGLLAARTAKAGWDIRKTGLSGGNSVQLCCYASKETHTWIQKAADMFGLGTDSIRWIPTDNKQRMDVSALEQRIREDRERGHQPFAVVGTAGSVSTGAVDALPEIAALCRNQNLWFHVDGAYGGIRSAGSRIARGSSWSVSRKRDSIAVDPHKWLLNAPLEAGCALVRNRRDLLHAFFLPPVVLQLQ